MLKRKGLLRKALQTLKNAAMINSNNEKNNIIAISEEKKLENCIK